jgi:hypothetical protein
MINAVSKLLEVHPSVIAATVYFFAKWVGKVAFSFHPRQEFIYLSLAILD